MVTMTMRYTGVLRCEAVHGPSGSSLLTDAPKDNHGKGEAFSPTDLIATALGTCILTTMGIAAAKLGVAMDGAMAVVEKRMSTGAPRRISALVVALEMPAGIAPEHRAALEHAAQHCPVKLSLNPEIAQEITFTWR